MMLNLQQTTSSIGESEPETLWVPGRWGGSVVPQKEHRLAYQPLLSWVCIRAATCQLCDLDRSPYTLSLSPLICETGAFPEML